MELETLSLKDKILGHFEQDLAAKLLEFIETLSKIETDVFILMSRKFCCLYDMLISISAPPLQKPIVSDKVLDLDTEFFKDKTVTILDDIIICGTTVWKAKEKLINELGAKRVNISVFCVNEKFWVKELVKPDYKAAVLSDDRSLTFCTSIVSSLSILPRPYSIEYPYFCDIEIKNRYWHQIISSNNWNVYDITTKIQEENDIATFTFFPSFSILEELKGTLGEVFFDTIDICKVRLYAKKLGWGMNISILPIITFKPLSAQCVETMLEQLMYHLHKSNNFNNTDKILNQFLNPESKLRLLQYSVSLILFSKLKSDFNNIVGKHIQFELRNIDIELLFGIWNIPYIISIFNILMQDPQEISFDKIECQVKPLDLEGTEIKILMEKENNTEVVILLEEDFQKDDPRNILADFSNIFLSLYFKKELPSREMVREAAKKNDFETIKNIDRLETGITWTGILEYLKSIFNYNLTVDIKNVLSLVLDYSIDKGICVPVIKYDPNLNIIYRAFRHGEDVKFAEEETELCGLTIEQAQGIMKTSEIPKLFLEKLLVLFIKIGASRKVFQIQYGTNGQEGIAKIGFHLMGAVVKLKKKNSYNAENNLWLSRHLLEKKVIKYSGKGLYSFNKHYPAIQVVSSAKLESQKFGLTLGMLYKGVKLKETTIRLNDDDLVFLSTCFRPRDVAAALYVEFDIYFEELTPIIQEILKEQNRDVSQRKNIVKNILHNKGYSALNQLHKKTIGWKTDGAKKAIEKGYRILDELGQPAIKLDWEAYWTSFEILEREDEEKTFNKFIKELSSIGHKILFYINLLEITLLYDNKTETNPELSQSFSKISRFFERSINLDPTLFDENEHKLFNNLNSLVESNFDGFNDLKTLSFINKRLKELNYESSKLIPLISNTLEEFEQRGLNTISYDYVIYYDIVDSTATKRMKTFQEVESYRNKVKRIKYSINNFIEKMQKEAFTVQDEIYCWNGDSSSTNDAKYVFLSSKRTGFSLRRVKEFIDRLFNLSDDDITFRAIVCPTNAFYSMVFRRFQRTEVEGELFWEHYSRVHKYFKELENKYSTMITLILLVGNVSSPIFSEKLNLNQKIWQGEIETVIAAGYYKTLGELWTLKI